jgi:hypothetical protein
MATITRMPRHLKVLFTDKQYWILTIVWFTFDIHISLTESVSVIKCKRGKASYSDGKGKGKVAPVLH